MNDMKSPKLQHPKKLQVPNTKCANQHWFGTWCLVLLWSLVLGSWSLAAAPVYSNNFESAELDKVPDVMLVLDGAFAVKQEDGNKVLELPGAPLDTFGALFGPTTNGNVAV